MNDNKLWTHMGHTVWPVSVLLPDCGPLGTILFPRSGDKKYKLVDEVLNHWWRLVDVKNASTLQYKRSGAFINCVGHQTGTGWPFPATVVVQEMPRKWQFTPPMWSSSAVVINYKCFNRT